MHATQIGIWKKKALEELAQVFTSRRSSTVREQVDLTATLYQQIGQLKWNWIGLKKKLPAGNNALRKLIDPAHEEISIQRQCERAGLIRSMYYYEPKLLGLKKYFLFYNTERQHQSLDYRTPSEVYQRQQSTGGIRTLWAA